MDDTTPTMPGRKLRSSIDEANFEERRKNNNDKAKKTIPDDLAYYDNVIEDFNRKEAEK